MFPSYKELNFVQSVCLVRISYKTNVVFLNSNGRLGYVTEIVCFHWSNDWNFMIFRWKAFLMHVFKLSLNKQQFFMSHTIRQTDMPTLLDDCITNAPSGKMLCLQNNLFFLYVCKNTTRLRVGLLRIGECFSFSCKIVIRRVTTYCCFVNDILI